MGIKQFIVVVFSFLIPITISCQNYPRFELYQLKQGTDSGQFIVTGLDSNLAFNNILRFRSADSTFLIGTDTVITDQSIIPILLQTIDAGLGIDVNQVDNQIFIESLSIEDSIYNGTGTLIAKGTPLYAVGVQGNYWSVAPADASDPSKMPVVVIAGEDIASGATGLGLIKGHIKQVNTTGLADGAEVYVASGGGYTSTKPTAEGVIIQRLGTVIKGNSTNGSGIINLGDEAYWNDYTSLTKLRDTLVIFRDSVTNQIGDSLVLYVSRVELNDSLINYVDRIELGDSLINYVDRVELGDSLALFLKTEVDGSITNEGSLTVNAGTDSTSVISSNTSGSTDVTLTAGSNITLSETGNNITIAASGGGTTYNNISETADTVFITGDLNVDANTLRVDATANRVYINKDNIASSLDNNQYTTYPNISTMIGGALMFSDANKFGFFASPNNIHLGRNAYWDGTAWKFIDTVGLNTSNAAGLFAVQDGRMSFLNSTNTPIPNTNITWANRFTIDNNGNVGIGTSSPSEKLEVNGNGLFTGNLTLNGNTITANNYKFNIDQDTTGKNGYLLGLNSSSGEIELQDISGSYINRTELSDTALAIRTDIPLIINDSLTARNFLTEEVDGSVTNEGSLTVGAGTDSTSVISSNTSGSTDVTLTAGTNITLSETGNNITIAASGGGSSLWSEGATTGEIYYNSGNVGIGLTDPEYSLHVSGRGYFTDDLRAFDRIYLGGDFNHTSGSYAPYIDRYAATGQTGMDFYAYNSGANGPLFRFFDSYDSYSEVFKLNSAASTYQIIANGDSDFNGDFNLDGRLDVNGFADFNSDQNASHDFGVGSLNHYPFMWVDASADKMAVGGGTPQYTLDVTGDINFTGTLYEDGSPFSAGGVTINNNTNNYLLTATGTANTINGESGLTWDNTYLKVYKSQTPYILLQNSTTGTSSGDGGSLSIDSNNEFKLYNNETNGSIILQNINGYILLNSLGQVKIGDLAGVSDIGANIDGVLQAATSDTTLKTNILPNQYGLKKVMDLETIKFNWKDKKSKGSQKEVGFNAQNLKKVIPEATYTIPSNGKLGIKDDAIIATLTKAIQEQQEMIEELQKEIKRIKRKIK